MWYNFLIAKRGIFVYILQSSFKLTSKEHSCGRSKDMPIFTSMNTHKHSKHT